ncbi:hypothetical protein Pla52n_22540 [Stieleria varia]|uniref:Uncharacterized protein n=1 Tax=Stieleria varia TaxID=2528005 RepID=A0A5C6B4P4_9BACT|nr:hypothetical protein Pla52n_22540 [Stieleria varia]
MKTAGLTTLGNSLSDSLGISFFAGPTRQEATSCELSEWVGVRRSGTMVYLISFKSLAKHEWQDNLGEVGSSRPASERNFGTYSHIKTQVPHCSG